MKISVLIPTLDESALLPATLAAIQTHAPHEIIVADGGSADGTPDIAAAAGCRVIAAPRGRAAQMNAAAQAASGDVFLFLHADCALEPGGYERMVETLRYGAGLPHFPSPYPLPLREREKETSQRIVGGAFSLGIAPPPLAKGGRDLTLRLIARLATWRARFWSLAYGDQAIFVRAATFRDLGGYALLPLCEDLDFYRRLARRGRTVILPQKAVVSPRRWLRQGIAATTLRNIAVAALFLLGVPAATLARKST